MPLFMPNFLPVFSCSFLRLIVVGALGVAASEVWAHEKLRFIEEASLSEKSDFVMTRKKLPLERAFSLVERHFGVSINYPLPLVRGYQVKTAFRARTAADAVGVLLMGLPFVYEVKGEYITIAPRAVQRSRGTLVVGRVVNEDRLPLSGIRVEIFGLGADERRQSGTLTNAEGEFQLYTGGLTESVLKVSGWGRETRSVVLRNPDFELQVGTLILAKADVALGEVIVTPKELVARADREIVYPPKGVEGAADGINLIEQLRSPGSRLLPTDVVLTEENFAALNVRINGRRARLFEVRALRFEDIIRVEYLYQPGSSGAEPYAINLITRPRPGGAVGVDVRALCFGEANLSAFGRMEEQRQTFSLHYEGKQTRWGKYWLDEKGALRTMNTQSSEPYRNEHHHLAFHSDFRLCERHRWRVSLSDDWQRSTTPRLVRASASASDTLTQRDYTHRPQVAVHYEGSAERHHRWEADIRWQHHHEVSHRHFRIAEAVSMPSERRLKGHEMEVNAAHHYQWKRWKTALETQFLHEYLRENAQTRYAFLSWQTNLGAQYSSRRWTIQAEVGVHHIAWDEKACFLLHPSLGVRFKPSESLAIWARAKEHAIVPTVYQRSLSVQPLDPYRRSVGGLNLRPEREWTTAFGVEARKAAWSASAGLEYTHSRAPIGHYLSTPYLYAWRNGCFSSDLSPFFAFDVALWPSYLRWRGRYAFHRLAADALTTHYHHLDSELGGKAGRWQYGVSVSTARRSLQGEWEHRTALSQQIFLRYAHASWTLGATVVPFRQREESVWRNVLDGGRIIRSLPNQTPQILFNFQWRFSVAPE